jgi:hypothetical protein
MTVHDCGSWRAWWGGARRTRGSMGSLGVRNDDAPTSISSQVTGKGGDDSFNLIWSHGSAGLIPQDRRPELALVTIRISTAASGADYSPLLVENELCRQFGTMKMPRARGRAAEIFDGSTTGPGPRKRSQPCRLLGGDGIGVAGRGPGRISSPGSTRFAPLNREVWQVARAAR